MRCPDKTPDEHGRLRALAEYDLDASHRLASLEPIVGLAGSLCHCPSAAVNLVGENSVFFAATHNVGACDMSRDVSFCAHAINTDGIMVIQDAALDERFADNPLVLDGMIRFYAGVALRAPSGHALGALCVIDGQPHAEFGPAERQHLRELGRLVEDRLELRRMDVASRQLPETRRQRAGASPSAVLSCDEQGIVVSCNRAAEHLLRGPAEAICGSPLIDRITADDRAEATVQMRDALAGQIGLTRELSLTLARVDGTVANVSMHCSHWHDGDALRIGVILRELSEPIPAGDGSVRPELADREQLLREVDQALLADRRVGLIVIGLVGYSDIASTLGHVAGNRMVRQLATQLERFAPEVKMLARIRDDEFALLVDRRDPLALTQLAREINAALAETQWIDGNEVRVGACAGIAIAPDHARDTEELFGNAALAMLQARSRGWGSVSLFTPSLRAQAVARRLAEAELHHAFADGQFELFYQPQVRLPDQQVIGAEALLRWNHPARGWLQPADFLPLLEASSLAREVGTWVLEQACAQLAVWRALSPELTIAVNLFAAQFEPGDLPETVAAILDRHGLDTDAIDIEITENIVLDRQENILRQIERLHAAGINLTFDDFGTGFASLHLLRSFPIWHIKVDKSFVLLAGESVKDRAIVASLIRMGHDLGLTVTAEGVETPSSALWLHELGCDRGQGYLFGRPCAAPHFADRHLAPMRRQALRA